MESWTYAEFAEELSDIERNVEIQNFYAKNGNDSIIPPEREEDGSYSDPTIAALEEISEEDLVRELQSPDW